LKWRRNKDTGKKRKYKKEKKDRGGKMKGRKSKEKEENVVKWSNKKEKVVKWRERKGNEVKVMKGEKYWKEGKEKYRKKKK